jgi:parallel beta-helix repeat protein
MYTPFAVLLFVHVAFAPSLALDIVVGKEDCLRSCGNYHKADTDAHPAIQSALNRVRLAGGGRVSIRQGEYIVSANFEMYSNTALVGEGMDKTVIKLQDYAAPWKVNTRTRAGFLRSVFRNEQKCENLYVAHLTLNGNKEKQNQDLDSQYGRYGYFTEGCTNVYMESVRIERFQGYGFDPHGWKKAPGGAMYGRNLTLINCVANDNAWDGFTLDQTDSIFMKNNTAYNNGRHGFNIITGSFNVYVTEAYTMDNGYYYYQRTSGCGLTIQNNMLYGTNDVVIVNSVFLDDNKGGICTNDVFDVTITNVAIVSKRECFNFANSRNFTVTNNMCNHTKIFREVNVTEILKSKNTVGMPSVLPSITFDITYGNTTYDAVGNDDIEGDETRALCSSGVSNKMVCCLASCGTCGGTQCGSRSGGSAGCCQTQIMASNRNCEDVGPPCIL